MKAATEVEHVGTRQAGTLLSIRPGTLAAAVWQNRLEAPPQGVNARYRWTLPALERASMVMRGRPLDRDEIKRFHEQAKG